MGQAQVDGRDEAGRGRAAHASRGGRSVDVDAVNASAFVVAEAEATARGWRGRGQWQ